MIWTEEEKEYLRREYPTRFTDELCPVLKRDVRAINQMAIRLGVKKEENFFHKHAVQLVVRMGSQKGRNLGRHLSPGTEFKKGHRFTGEAEKRRLKGLEDLRRREKVRVKYGLQQLTKWNIVNY